MIRPYKTKSKKPGYARAVYRITDKSKSNNKKKE